MRTLGAVICLLSAAAANAGPVPGPPQPVVTFTDADRLEWEAGTFDRLWNVYRGDLDVLKATGEYTQEPGSNGLALRACGRNAPWYEDPAAPPPGSVAFYLVTAVVSTVEGGLGPSGDAASRPNGHRCSEGYFCVRDVTEDSFVLKVVDPEDLDHARLVAYGVAQEPRVHVSGQVALAPAGWNPGWSFHVVPESVGYFELAIELCDATIAYVNQFGGPAPGSGWCPWSSEILYELPSPGETEPDGIAPQPCGPLEPEAASGRHVQRSIDRAPRPEGS